MAENDDTPPKPQNHEPTDTEPEGAKLESAEPAGPEQGGQDPEGQEPGSPQPDGPKRKSRWRKQRRPLSPQARTYLKLAALAMLMLASLFPLELIHGLVVERQARSTQVEREIARLWGGQQRIVGPIVMVPVTRASGGFTIAPKSKAIQGFTGSGKPYRAHLYILPDTLSIHSALSPQRRHRGIFEAVVYGSQTTLSGSFGKPDLEALGIDEDDLVYWDKAQLKILVTDFHGIVDVRNLDWNGASLPFRTGDTPKNEILTSLPDLGAAAAPWPAAFAFAVHLNGTRSFGLMPLAERADVTMKSPWPHPSFFGDRLPIRTTVSEDGFEARWELSHFDRELPRAWLGNDKLLRGLLAQTQNQGVLVRLVEPVNTYLKSERSVKYGLLFVILVSCVLFVFEILSGGRVHPVQYTMVAAALCLFFLLLLSLSEMIGFAAAYGLAAALTIGLLSYYVAGIFRSLARGATLAGLLGVVYGYMYLTLRSEDHALLLGSCLLFAALALAMTLTRRLDWYRIGGHLVSARKRKDPDAAVASGP